MTREEQIIEAGKIAAEGKEFSVLVKRQHRTMSAYEIGFIEGAQWADSYPNWISVEEKLPEECELVYAIREGNVEPGIYKFMAKDQWEWAPRFIACLDDITHWMPLPKPPRKEE